MKGDVDPMSLLLLILCGLCILSTSTIYMVHRAVIVTTSDRPCLTMQNATLKGPSRAMNR